MKPGKTLHSNKPPGPKLAVNRRNRGTLWAGYSSVGRGVCVLAALLATGLLLALGVSTYRDYKVYTQGCVVPATILDVYNGRWGGINLLVDGRSYFTQNPIAPPGSRKKGNVVTVKFLADYGNHTLMPGWNPMPGDIALMVAASVMLVFFVYRGFRPVSAARRGLR